MSKETLMAFARGKTLKQSELIDEIRNISINIDRWIKNRKEVEEFLNWHIEIDKLNDETLKKYYDILVEIYQPEKKYEPRRIRNRIGSIV